MSSVLQEKINVFKIQSFSFLNVSVNQLYITSNYAYNIYKRFLPHLYIFNFGAGAIFRIQLCFGLLCFSCVLKSLTDCFSFFIPDGPFRQAGSELISKALFMNACFLQKLQEGNS